MLTDLLELVERYTRGDSAFSDFRRAFVIEFLVPNGGNSEIQELVLAIESACDDFSECLLSEIELKSRFVALMGSPRPSQVIVAGAGVYSSISTSGTSSTLTLNFTAGAVAAFEPPQTILERAPA
jgi:hypothetical protein